MCPKSTNVTNYYLLLIISILNMTGEKGGRNQRWQNVAVIAALFIAIVALGMGVHCLLREDSESKGSKKYWHTNI